MSEQIEARMTFESGNSNMHTPAQGKAAAHDALARMDDVEEFEWLMSLALDNALAPDEAARFDRLLHQAAENEARWERWQALDNAFHEMPAVLPPVDFADKFALRLEIQERQRRLRTGVIFGLAAIALWGSALVGLVMLGALAWSNQGVWMADIIQNVATWWSAAGQFVQTLRRTAEALWSAPQARAVLAAYLVCAVLILGAWFAFLRRSTRELPVGETQMVEV